MQHSKQLYQLLLAALMLLGGSLNAAAAGTALHKRSSTKEHTVLRAGKPHLPWSTFKTDAVIPGEMALSEGHAPSPGLHSRQEDGSLAHTPADAGNTFYALSLHDERPGERLRWQLLCSHIHYAQLAAHYPAHGFW